MTSFYFHFNGKFECVSRTKYLQQKRLFIAPTGQDVSSYEVELTVGNVTLTIDHIVLASGEVCLSGCDVTFSCGEMFVVGNDVTLACGEITSLR